MRTSECFECFRVADVIGYVPQELIGSSFYEFYHRDDVPRLAEDHKACEWNELQ
eukprot:m.63594 g.63594  ORF g.63594 m.63594 type:complete len:54 (+) comp35176_c1_seq3:1167-1328(+)